MAVAPSDPKTIYVGTGQVTSRYDGAAGAGVFKSKDAGASWTSIGLEATRHIGAIVVDPRHADVVLVAAMGHIFGPNPERGVYRSEDGGSLACSAAFPRPTTLINCCTDSAGTCTFFFGGLCIVPGNSGPGPCCVDRCADGGLCSCLESGSCYGAGQLFATDASYICPVGVPGW